MTHNPIDHPTAQPIEPWQLTAYALNELDIADATKVEQALEADPSLRTELEQIQLTLSTVRSALAVSSTHVKLDEKQSAAIASQIEQSVAPNPTSAVATLKLTERPFYRRKRFAALLATAAAIPLAATWGPMLLDSRSPLAYTAKKDVKVSSTKDSGVDIGNLSERALSAPLTTHPNATSSRDLRVLESEASHVAPERVSIVASPDAVSADSGLLGDVDVSFAPDMGLVIIKGSKRDVEQAQGEIERLKERMAEEPMSRIAASNESNVANEEARGKVDLYSLSLDVAPQQNKNLSTLSKKAGDKQAGEPEQLAQSGQAFGGMGGGYGGGYGGGNRGGYSEGGSAAIGGYGGVAGGVGAEGEGRMRGMGVGIAGGLVADSAGYGGEASPVTTNGVELQRQASEMLSSAGGKPAAPILSTPQPSPAAGNTRLLAESDFFHDKRTRDTDLLSDLPDELRSNVRRFNPKAQDNLGTDRFERIVETPFVETQKAPLSTFSIDVDTASYSKIRQTLLEGNRLPSPSMVRIEEMVNYFQYEYAGPQDGRPFASHMIVDRCPWNPEHQLVRVGLQAKKIDTEARVKANIVFLLDVSGSMNEPNKLPLVKKSLAMMVNQLTENDRVAIVVYAGAAGCVLPSTCGIDKQRILSALDHLQAGGSTNGGQGIQLAYSIAKEHFVPGGANRVVLCTDGDFNVGVTGDDALVAMMQENAKSNVFLTCLGFGAGNYNDTMMEKISNKGNGVYGMIDNELEGRRMMVEQLGGTLVTVAKDVKIQVDFNSAKIAGYRLIGYEDRRLANKDFSDDKKDAGEIGAGHRVTALYEVIPAGKWFGAKNLSDGEVSKYAKKPEPKIEVPATGENASELLTLRVRYKEPEASESTLQEFVLKDTAINDNPQIDRDMRWVTAVAEFGLLLRRSEMAPSANWSDMLERATNAAGGDPYRLECLTMMRKAMGMMR